MHFTTAVERGKIFQRCAQGLAKLSIFFVAGLEPKPFERQLRLFAQRLGFQARGESLAPKHWQYEMPVTALRHGLIRFELIIEVEEPAETLALNDEIVEWRKDSRLCRFDVIRHVFQRFG